MTADDPDREARLAEIAEHDARRARLTGQHGKPEHISNADALAAAQAAKRPIWTHENIGPDDWIIAHIYRDAAAADAWLESNRVHYGHPTLAKVPLPDGRVVGILDLRAERERARETARRLDT